MNFQPKRTALDEGLLREVKRRLAERDQRFTTGRAALLEVFASAKQPLGVQDLIDLAPARTPQSSVYRNVGALCDAGVLERLNFDEGFVRYELAQQITEHHHHFVCSICKSVIDLDDALMTDVEAAIKVAEVAIEGQGFQVHEHQLELMGICANCGRGA